MTKILVINRQNNMGDAMCQMRVLKEWKEHHPEVELDFISCYYLHWLMAKRTDLFNKCEYVKTLDEVNGKFNNFRNEGYDDRIEFLIDFWGTAAVKGILKAWGINTLNYEATTDRPYFLTNEEDQVCAKAHYGVLGGNFRKTAVVQLQAPSDGVRSFRPEDYERVLDMFPEDVGIIYPTSIDKVIMPIFQPRKNLLMLPGYSVGYTAELMKLVDVVFSVHGGLVMLAYAVGAKPIVQVMFNEGGSPEILRLKEEDGINLNYPNNREINWEEMHSAILNFVA